MRASKIEPEEESPKERALRGEKWHKVKRLNLELTFKRKRIEIDEEQRWYALGCIQVAYMHIYPEGTQRPGNVQIFMNSKVGNGGEWFANLNEAKAYMYRELKRIP